MRWKGWIIFVVLAVLMIVVSAVFLDRWIETGLEKAGEAIVGAKVEIDRLDFQWSGPSIVWQRLQAADPDHPMQNLIETGRTAFRMEPGALWRKKVVIDEMTLAGVRSGTPRKTDGALHKKPVKPLKNDQPDFLDQIRVRLADEVDRLPVMHFDPNAIKRKLNLDTLVVEAGLKTVGKIDSAKTVAVSAVQRWEAFSNSFAPDEDLKKIEADFKAVDPKKIKTVPELVSLVDKAVAAQRTVQAVSDTFQFYNQAIRADITGLSSASGLIDDWVAEDIRSVMQKAELPDLSVRTIAKTLVGGPWVSQFDKYMGIYRKIRKAIPEKQDKPKKETVPRFQGQDIPYPERHAWPSFLIRKISLSGQTGTGGKGTGLMLLGEISNVTPQPWVTGKALVVDLSGKTGDNRSAVFQAVLDRVTRAVSDSFQVRFTNVRLDGMKLQNSKYLPSLIRQGLADFDLVLRVRENDLLASLDMAADKVKFDFPAGESSDMFMNVVRKVIGETPRIDLGINVFGGADDVRFNVSSNIDDQVSSELQRIGSAALAEAKARITAKIAGIRAVKQKELESIFVGKLKSVETFLSQYDVKIGDSRNLLTTKIDGLRKEIDDRKKAEEDKLKNKAKDILDGLIKK